MADGATPPRPIGPAERIDAIDVLRGIALLGVVAMNVVTIFRVSIFERFLFPKPPLSFSSIDSAVETILMLAVDLKALALFSLLFGAGLAIQFERLARSERRTSLLVRRLVVLLAFGLIHLCLIWNGDILTEYALAGFIVLPFLFGPRWLLAVAALASLGLYLAMQVFPPPGLWPGTAALGQDVAEAQPHLSDGRLPRRAGVPAPRDSPFRCPARLYLSTHDRLVSSRRVRLAHRHSAKPVTPSAVLDRRRLYRPWRGIDPLPCRRLDRRAGRIRALAEPLGTILLALGYGAAIIGIANLASGKRLLGWAAPLGRMAFTNYLAQSVILGWIFYGYGLGLFGRLGVTSALAIGVAVYFVQVPFSAWWLRRYRYGPVEWLWRTLMYGVAQPMRQTA